MSVKRILELSKEIDNLTKGLLMHILGVNIHDKMDGVVPKDEVFALEVNRNRYENYFAPSFLSEYLEIISAYYEADKLYYLIKGNNLYISESSIENYEVYFSDC